MLYEIAEFSLKVKPNDEWFLTSKVLSISILDLTDKASQLKESISKLLEIGINDLNHVRIITNVLIENGGYKEALDLPFMKKPKTLENIPARIDYFLSTTKIPNDFLKSRKK